MNIQWNQRITLILMLALSLACVYTAKTAGTSTPQTGPSPEANTAKTPGTRILQTRQSPETNTAKTAGTGTTQTGQSLDISLSSGGKTRDAWVHIPASYSSATAVPLIVTFHGFGSDGKGAEAETGLSALADSEGFLVAYPNGMNRQWYTDPGSAGAADRQFIRDLVKNLQTDYKVDPKRIFATGMSNGGGMTHRVGCDLADIFAAIAPVEGGYASPGWQDCSPSRPMPIMAFHGITDPVVPYNGGPGKGAAAGHIFPSIPDWAAAWANRDSCNATPTVTTPTVTQPNAIAVTRQEWTQCKDGASVILFSINPHAHTWPKGKPINATTEMWKFFQAHPMP
jgi:polyhydroxybutyrate depolymerase